MADASIAVPHELGQQIVNHVKQLLSKDSALCDIEGIVIASSYADRVGTTVAEAVRLTTQEPKVISGNSEPSIITPLILRGQTAASLVIYNDPAWQDHVKLVKSLAELLGERYLELQEPLPESRDRIIYRLLKTEPVDQLESLAAEATVSGFDLSKPRVAMAIRLDNFWQTFFKGEDGAESRESNISRFHNKIEQALNGFFTSSTDNIVAYLGDDLFVVLKDLESTGETKFSELMYKNFNAVFAPMKNNIIKEISVGVGSYHEGLSGMRESFREAMLALELGERIQGPGKLYHINNLGIAGIIAEASIEKKMDFADRLLGPLLPQKELMRTMEEFFKHNLNLTNAAEALEIHRNTLIYRLDKIASIVNLDPRRFQEAVQIYLALLIKRIYQ